MQTIAKSKSGVLSPALITPLLVLAALFAVTPGRVSAVVFTENNTYDFSQTGNATWVNYCAPTVAGDLIYHFGNTYPSLVQGNNYGPGNQPGANTGVTTIIGGLAAVNPADPPGSAGSLAALMGTTRNGGTTLDNMKAGLVQYLANNSAVAWNTQMLLASSLSAVSAGRLFSPPCRTTFRLGMTCFSLLPGRAASLEYQLYDTPELQCRRNGCLVDRTCLRDDRLRFQCW